MSLINRLVSLPQAIRTLSMDRGFDRAVQNVHVAFPRNDAVKPDDIEALIRKLSAAISHWKWGELTEGEMASIILAFAQGNAAMPRQIRDFLSREIKVCTNDRLLGALCYGFIFSWKPQDERLRGLANIIEKRANYLPEKWQNLFRRTPDLLDLDNGGTSFGQWMVHERDAFQSVIARGISRPHGPGFMEHAHAAWLQALPVLDNEAAIEGVLAWIVPESCDVLAGERGSAAVSRLLEPWLSVNPPDKIRARLLTKLVDAYGDLRNDNSHFWTLINERARRVLLRWLAGRQMEAFLDVVSRAEEGNSRGQWASRHSFWKGMYDQGYIDEAWVAFTEDAKSIARRRFTETGDQAYTGYGNRVGPRRDTCLLIMSIRNKIVIEGSHNFRIHVFSKGDPQAPKLYAERYDVDHFLLPHPHDDARVHDEPGGLWREWARKKLL